jgi:hypothetical protein
MDLLKPASIKNRKLAQQAREILRATRFGQLVESVTLADGTLHVLFRVGAWETATRVYPLAARQVLTYADALRRADLAFDDLRLSGTYPLAPARYAGPPRLRVVVDAVYPAAVVRRTDWPALDDAEVWPLAARKTLDSTFATLL